jgi:hypothetical protein
MEGAMERWIKKIVSVFVSAAFAEMYEHDHARNILGIKYVDPKTMWDEVFVSVTFAEAG